MQKIGRDLEGEQIPYIPLKGAILRHLYPAPELRTSCDIDVLVKEDDVEEAVAVIENATDFVKMYRQAYAVIKQQVETAILQSATIDLPLSHRVCHP